MALSVGTVSIVAGLLLMIPAFQMIAGQPAPIFPRRIAAYPLPTRHLAALVQRAVPVLRYLEKMIHPRWPTPFQAINRHFYKFTAPRKLAAIDKDLKKAEDEILRLLREVTE